MSFEQRLMNLKPLSLNPSLEELQTRRKELDVMRDLLRKANAREQAERKLLQSSCFHPEKVERGALHESWYVCKVCNKSFG